MQRGWWIAAALLMSAGCGDDGAGSADTDGGGSTSTSTGVPDDTTSDAASSSGSADTSSGADTSSDGTSSSGVDASSSGETLTMLDVEVALYPQQPMVVDVTVTGDGDLPEDLSLAHDFDEGVRIAVLEDGAQVRTYRVRGLAPATKHALTITGGAFTEPVAFTSEVPLPGFVPSFEVSGTYGGEGPFRMFDLIPFPDFSTASLFVVDPEGRTRFHFGQPSGALPGPDSVFAAAQLRDDGSVLLVHDNAVIILDELGEETLRLNDEDLGLTGLHHDVQELDNGNFLSISYSFQTVDYPDVGPTLTAGDVIAEFTPEGEVVWQWDSFDDLDPQYTLQPTDGSSVLPHPMTGELAYDWTHANGIVLSPDGSSVMISLRHQDWLVSINRDTADMEWRLGPGGDLTLQSGEWFHHQHSPQWQADGSLILYDNGVGPAGPQRSRVVRYTLDTDAMEATQVFVDDDLDTTSVFAGDADVLPSTGNILVMDSAIFNEDGAVTPRMREIDPEQSPMMIWEMTYDLGYFSYRATANDRLVGEAAR